MNFEDMHLLKMVFIVYRIIIKTAEYLLASFEIYSLRQFHLLQQNIWNGC